MGKPIKNLIIASLSQYADDDDEESEPEEDINEEGDINEVSPHSVALQEPSKASECSNSLNPTQNHQEDSIESLHGIQGVSDNHEREDAVAQSHGQDDNNYSQGPGKNSAIPSGSVPSPRDLPTPSNDSRNGSRNLSQNENESGPETQFLGEQNVQIDQALDASKDEPSEMSEQQQQKEQQQKEQQQQEKEQQEQEQEEDQSMADFLPAPTEEQCPPKLQEKIVKYLALKRMHNGHLNEKLRESKGYRNPDFMQQAVHHQGIDEIGSCFQKEVFDPHGYDPEEYFDQLMLEIRKLAEKREQERKERARVDFQKGGTLGAGQPQKPIVQLVTGQKGVISMTSQPSGVKTEGGRERKRSKWDKMDNTSSAVAASVSTLPAPAAMASMPAAEPILLKAPPVVTVVKRSELSGGSSRERSSSRSKDRGGTRGRFS